MQLDQERLLDLLVRMRTTFLAVHQIREVLPG